MDIDSNIRTYSDIGEHAFGKPGKIIVSLLVNLELYTAAIALLICGGDNLHVILPNMKFEIINGVLTIDGTQSSLIIASLVIMPTVWLTNLKLLSYVSATGVIAIVVLLISVVWATTLDGIKFQEKGTLINWSGIPTAVSLYAVCYCGHPVFPTLYTSMRNKRQFSQVLIISFVFTTLTCAAMGILGYLMFGSNVLSQITLNLPTTKISSNVAIYTTLINPLSKYAVIIAPIVSSIENRFISGSNKRSLTSTLMMRTTLLITTVIVALAFPFFGTLMSIIGAFVTMATSVILPCVCFLKISGMYRRREFELFIIFLVVLTGMFIMIIGTYVSILDIIRQYSITGTI